jgi:Uma2 family endonuclease
VSTSIPSAETTALLFECPRLLSVEQYHRMGEAGIFDEGERVELLEGVIVAMTPQSSSHARRIQILTGLLARALGSEWAVRAQLPLTLGPRNEPEPDLAVVRADATSEDRHPSSAVLVIEVSGDSLRRDRQVKSAVYARGGVPEYWVVSLDARSVEVYTDPDVGAGTYRRVRTCTLADTLASETLPPVSFPVSELFS